MDSAWTRDVGVGLMGRAAPPRAAAWSRAAERAGLGSIWFVEDYFQPGAFAIAGAGAAVTEHVAVGLGVLNPPCDDDVSEHHKGLLVSAA